MLAIFKCFLAVDIILAVHVRVPCMCVYAGLADGLRASIDPLVAGSPLPALLLTACADQCEDVRQSAFALLGDLAKACPR